MADQFVRVRLLRITGADLHLFEFDYDLTWAAFFLNADEEIYGRYGGRDSRGPDTRNSLPGLRFAMQAALKTHQQPPSSAPKKRPAPLLVENLTTAKQFYRTGCIHCHQTADILRQEKKKAGQWQAEDRWVFPLPENVGLVLDVDQGNLVKAVKDNSPASQAGLRGGDILDKLNGFAIYSFADAQFALHKGPVQGGIEVSWQRQGARHQAELKLERGWIKTNLTWRPSMLELLPSLTIFGKDLNAQEKQTLGLSAERLAFRQAAPVHAEARAMGVQAGDIVLGVDDLPLKMSMEEFLGYVRRNYLIGDQVTLNILRGGKPHNLRVKLR